MAERDPAVVGHPVQIESRGKVLHQERGADGQSPLEQRDRPALRAHILQAVPENGIVLRVRVLTSSLQD